MRHLLEQALAPEGGEDDPLYRAALEVKRDEQLATEMAEWDGAIGDGSGAEAVAARVSRPAAAVATVRRGEVWWVDLDPTRGSEIRKTRLAVVLTVDGLKRARRTAALLSAGPAPRPPIVVETASAGVGSVAVCDQMRAVDKGRLTEHAGQLTVADLRAVEDGVRAVLGL